MGLRQAALRGYILNEMRLASARVWVVASLSLGRVESNRCFDCTSGFFNWSNRFLFLLQPRQDRTSWQIAEWVEVVGSARIAFGTATIAAAFARLVRVPESQLLAERSSTDIDAIARLQLIVRGRIAQLCNLAIADW